MRCRTCNGRAVTQLGNSYPAGNPRASLDAARAARQLRDDTGTNAHIHYDTRTDSFVIVRTQSRTNAA